MIKLINTKGNIFGDNIAFVENWDFSQANLNEENRIKAITQVASICYQNPKALGSESLYNRLMAESMGLPSSSFEFVPVLLTWGEVIKITDLIEAIIQKKDENGEVISSCVDTQTSNIEKYGEWIEVDDCKYLLTNFRAVVYDFEQYGDRGVDLRSRFNTEEECKIIKEHFKVFLYKVDLPTRSQMVRHRINWQELSRRYVSGKRVPFEFYISEKLQNNPKVEALIKQSEDLYFELLENGVKPQEARRVIPQMGYTQIWGAFQPTQLANYFRLRDDNHAQWEIRQTAIAMKELIKVI